MWGVRYFLLPAVPDWGSPGAACLVPERNRSDLSRSGVLYERQSRDGQGPWGMRQDWQLRRNRAAYPRAWVVHHARIRPPAADPDERRLDADPGFHE